VTWQKRLRVIRPASDAPGAALPRENLFTSVSPRLPSRRQIGELQGAPSQLRLLLFETRKKRTARMQTYVDPSQMLLDVAATLNMDPDILALAAYIARRRNLTLGELLEQLITSDRLKLASTAGIPESQPNSLPALN